jgi:hypothetical protein
MRLKYVLLSALVNSDRMRGSLCPASHGYGESFGSASNAKTFSSRGKYCCAKNPSGLVSSLSLRLAFDLSSLCKLRQAHDCQTTDHM